MITREADYAFRTVLYLAQNYGKGPISTTDISETMEIPYRFLRKISHNLVEAKLVGATRGKHGGIFLKVDPASISFLDILKLFDDRAINLNICCKADDACTRSPTCAIHERLVGLQERLQAEFEAFKFSDLV